VCIVGIRLSVLLLAEEVEYRPRPRHLWAMRHDQTLTLGTEHQINMIGGYPVTLS
jgi:hypothetical protein